MKVDWIRSIALMVARVFSTGVVLTILLYAFGVDTPFNLLTFPLFFPFLAALWIPLGLLAGKFAGGWLMLIVSLLFCCLGDPIVYAINKVFPNLFAAADLKVINSTAFLKIVEPQKFSASD